MNRTRSLFLSLCALTLTLAAGASPAQATTQTFASTGGEQIFVVPGGVTKLHVLLIGAEGGAVGGLGAQVGGDLGVIPGQTLYLEVGGVGQDGGTGGFIGGAAGGAGAGGGGGATDIRLAPRSFGLAPDTRLAVAAGGGGGAGDGEDPGGVGGDAEEFGETSLGGNEGGGPGTASTGGGGGFGCSLAGTSGELGAGGAGGAGFSTNSGGGGGGGLYGGGGGGGGCTSGGGGGGGGSSLVPAGGTLALAPEGVAPTVAITYTLPAVAPPTNQPLPNTVLGFHPPKKVKTAKAKAKVKFTFSSNVANAGFKCKLDKAAFAPCTSPKRYKVKPGKHKFSVEAVSGAGVDPSPATFSFKVVKTS